MGAHRRCAPVSGIKARWQQSAPRLGIGSLDGGGRGGAGFPLAQGLDAELGELGVADAEGGSGDGADLDGGFFVTVDGRREVLGGALAWSTDSRRGHG
jgi:hypothetical protein